MKRLDFHAERVGDYGSITGQGAEKLLGAPKKDRLEILVREAVQNSWDARIGGRTPLRFELDLRTLTNTEARVLSGTVFTDGPDSFPRPAEPVRILTVSDYGAKGLGGPVRPTEVGAGPADFVNFVYMIGESKVASSGVEHPGGTYGYGRSSFFGASKARTILVHTHAISGATSESRFVGIAWFPKSRARKGPAFTGRTWWGRTQRRWRGWTGPLIGDEADELAASLGLKADRRGYGTSVVIIDPDLGERSEEDACRFLESSMLWNCWPRIHSGELQCRMLKDSSPRPEVSPDEHPRLKLFVRSLRAVDAGKDRKDERLMCEILRCYRPKADLGRLAISRGAFAPIPGSDEVAPVSNSEPIHHVALMRSTRLVVGYEEGPAPEDGTQYAGAFTVNSELESIFASSEPPAHDDWVKERLEERNHRIFVNRAKQGIIEASQLFASRGIPEIGIQMGGPLGGIADELGSLLLGSDGEGTARHRPPPKNKPKKDGKKPPSALARVEVHPGELTWRDGRVLLRIPFTVRHLPGTAGTTLHAYAAALIEGTHAEGLPPLGADSPELYAWDLVGEMKPLSGSRADAIVPKDIENAALLVAQPEDCSVRVEIQVAE